MNTILFLFVQLMDLYQHFFRQSFIVLGQLITNFCVYHKRLISLLLSTCVNMLKKKIMHRIFIKHSLIIVYVSVLYILLFYVVNSCFIVFLISVVA